MTASFQSCKISSKISTTILWGCKSKSVRRTWWFKVKMARLLNETKPSRTWKPKSIDYWTPTHKAIKPHRTWWDSWPKNKSNWMRPIRILSAWMAQSRPTIRRLSKNRSDWILKSTVWTIFSKLLIMIFKNRLRSSTTLLKNSKYKLLIFKRI